MKKRVLRTTALALAILAFVQTSIWIFFSRNRVFAAAFLHDVERSEKYVESQYSREVSGSDFAQYLLICEAVAVQLSGEEISDASARYERLFAVFDGKPPQLLTAAQWMDGVRDKAFQSGRRPYVDGICASGRANNPLYATVLCDDRTFSDFAQHGHEHVFLHFLGKWIPVWTGHEWVS